MDYKDYYKILGVSPDADNQTVKKAFKELAKKYHPDQNLNDPSAEEKFKEINEAYQAVSDPAKRQKYDDLRRDYEQWQQYGSQNNSGFDWSAWGSPGGTSYSRTMSEEDLSQFFGSAGLGDESGAGGFSDFFSMLFGFGNGGAGRGRSQRAADEGFFRRSRAASLDGRDLEGEISITLDEAYHGGARRVEVNGKVLEAQIPRGVPNGARIRLTGQGEPGSSGGRKGDLLLKVIILSHPFLKRDEDDLRMTLEIDFYTAVLGGEVLISGLAGQDKTDNQLWIKIPPRTQNGRVFRLKGKGMPALNKKNQFGDLYAEVAIVLPQDLKHAEITKLRDMAKKYGRIGPDKEA